MRDHISNAGLWLSSSIGIATFVMGFWIVGCGLSSLKDVTVKDVANTIDDAAKIACGVFADTHGLSLQDICETKEDLQPYIDAILSADQIAGSMHGVSMEEKADGGS